ncbi:sec-independent translocase [Nocardioides perillae]|uniref:Sec-independent protein translocase protein TatB n=1 Tax=Nocardioides perillae TaxID=1119534 RepID=A0A7Y9RUP3_9ACTN|nr:sec-independent protein translocase protein TatB [Nocardioides perillae]
MFGVGLTEMVVIAFVAIFVFGPDKLPEFARQSGRLIRRVRDLANGARDDLRAELGPAYADLELRDLDPRAIVRKHVMEALAEEDDAEERRRRRRAGAVLGEGEVPPYDVEAT